MKTKVICSVAVGLVLFAAPFVIAARFHDHQIAQIQAEVTALPHPPSSTLVAHLGGIATWGNGYPFKYWAFEVRSFSGSPATLIKAYKGLSVPVPDSAHYGSAQVKDSTQAVEIEVLPSPLPTGFYIPIGMTSGCWMDKFAGKRGLYVVEVVSSGDNDSLAAKLDWWRCGVV